MSEGTPAEKLGIYPGTKVMVTCKGQEFPQWTTITLVRDDGDESPLFEDENGERVYVNLYAVKPPYPKPESEVTITTTYGDLAKVYACTGSCNGGYDSLWFCIQRMLDRDYSLRDKYVPYDKPNCRQPFQNFVYYKDAFLSALFPQPNKGKEGLQKEIEAMQEQLNKLNQKLQEMN